MTITKSSAGRRIAADATRVLIMGAAGRDFHNFNTVFRNNPAFRVVAFTAAQIPDIAGREYPPALSGELYPKGIPIYPEEELLELIRRLRVDYVYLSYSDLSHMDVMHKASQVLAAGASFGLLGPHHTMLSASIPVISVCAVRTGCGKSPTSRRVARWLIERGYRLAIIRHPMPYGDLERQAAQRFATASDLDAAQATVEEREEYEPYIRMGIPVYAGVDYAMIMDMAQKGAQVLLWDGGNNDFPFIRPDLHIVLLDPHRPGHEVSYYPGETNLRMADVCVINKVDSAPKAQVDQVVHNIRNLKPRVSIVMADSLVVADRPDLIQGKRAVIVEDGPTLTHGGMTFGAGTLAAQRYGALERVDARPFAVGAIAEIFQEYPHLQGEVPAMGYSPHQIQDLEATLNNVQADVIIDATPVDLSHLVHVNKPIVNVEYEFQERGSRFTRILERFEGKYLRRPTT